MHEGARRFFRRISPRQFPASVRLPNERIFKCKWDLARGSMPSKFARGSVIAAMANRVQRCANCFNPELVFIRSRSRDTAEFERRAQHEPTLGADASIFPSSAAPEKCNSDVSRLAWLRRLVLANISFHSDFGFTSFRESGRVKMLFRKCW